MIEIIPNYHPIFVHFTVALLSVSTGFFVLAYLFRRHKWRQQWLTTAYWNLWVGAGITILTLAAGWYAFNTVDHDTPSHEAMLEHRSWALATVAVILLVAAWSIRRYARSRPQNPLFVGSMVLVWALITATAWHGAELVYRHGLGVMSLPKVENHGAGHGGHTHGTEAVGSGDEHGDDHAHDSSGQQEDHEHDDSHEHDESEMDFTGLE